MKFKNIKGREVYKNCSEYRVDWDADCRSKIQKKIKQFLKKHWQLSVVFEEFPVYGTRMTVDILNATRMVGIEIDGKQHGKFNKFFHNDNRANFLSQIKRDVNKETWCEINNIKLVRITEDEANSFKDQEDFDNFYNKHIK